jgi:hemin uptake protein HemP
MSSGHDTLRSGTKAGMPAGLPPQDGVRKIDARVLLGNERELVIVHAGREYRLRVTSNGKLILTA